MKTWKQTNRRGFKITFTDGSTTTIEGSDIDPINVLERAPYKYWTIHSIEEYFYEDTVKWAIKAQQDQIDICKKQIEALEKLLEAAE